MFCFKMLQNPLRHVPAENHNQNQNDGQKCWIRHIMFLYIVFEKKKKLHMEFAGNKCYSYIV